MPRGVDRSEEVEDRAGCPKSQGLGRALREEPQKLLLASHSEARKRATALPTEERRQPQTRSQRGSRSQAWARDGGRVTSSLSSHTVGGRRDCHMPRGSHMGAQS